MAERGSTPGVPLCAVKLSSRELMEEVYRRLDALGLEGTLVTHVCPVRDGVERALVRWCDCPWYQPNPGQFSSGTTAR